ncbi:hypothetical protein CROQUDRAFT_135842 [Cronartium quercuum f. sp. fusiforme G11]|uniref:Uncharacterized protein n=1 Tax=Cronartium quercuum f. sp. fusiforme G11 TaxID=708437 RepID=A0A9P6N8N1_9BASI|nr:hypothetical protein CROQUDRAFT_135842 [Cronartium quercuum f. sp. fusiforme G11]
MIELNSLRFIRNQRNHIRQHFKTISTTNYKLNKLPLKPSTPSSSENTNQPTLVQAVIATYLPSIRSLAAKLPHLRTPPTPTDLLPLADSFLHRLQIRFKWLTIRSFRPYRSEDYSAFASLLVLLSLIIAALATTSFLGVLLLIFNKAGAEDLVARWLSDYLSKTTGVRIYFASALVPRWRDGLIRFENVIIHKGKLSLEPDLLFKQILLSHNIQDHFKHKNKLKQRHLLDRSPLHHHPDDDNNQLLSVEEDPLSDSINQIEDEQEPSNFTHFHLTIATIDVTLSLRRWLDGKGLIRQASVSGLRGVIDRSHLNTFTNGDDDLSVILNDRSKTRRKALAGDFELEQLIINDLLVTIYQPANFRPYTLSIFNAELNKLRKQWILLDLFSAEKVTGQLDNCLFSLHRPQSLIRSNLQPSSDSITDSTTKLKKRYETHLSRFRIDGLPIDHFQSKGDNSSPLSWILSGKVDLIADIKLPKEFDSIDLRSVVREIVDNFEKQIATPSNNAISERPELVKPALEPPIEVEGKDLNQDQEVVLIELDIRLKDVKASVPLFHSNLSYVNHALVRPIVAFINSNKTLIPIRCSLTIPLDDFNGSWTAYDIALVENIAAQVYSALAYHVSADGVNKRRAGLVGLWSVQLTARALLGALRLHWDAAH